MSIDILVADDETPVRAELAALLAADERVGTIYQARSGAETLQILSAVAVTVAFIDIHMPGMSGLDLARALGQLQQRPAVVFVTADDTRAVEAFEVQAVDYLLKPVRMERLRAALSRGIEARPISDASVRDESVAVHVGSEMRMLRRSDVRWVQAQGDYSRLWTSDRDYLLRTPISELAERWEPAGFIRVHRSYLVRESAITSARLSGSAPVVVLAEVELPVSRRQLADVKERLLRT